MTTEITVNNLAKYFAQRNGDNDIDANGHPVEAFDALVYKHVYEPFALPHGIPSYTLGNPYSLFADFEGEPGNQLTRTCGIAAYVWDERVDAFIFTNDTVAGETITVLFTITMTRG